MKGTTLPLANIPNRDEKAHISRVVAGLRLTDAWTRNAQSAHNTERPIMFGFLRQHNCKTRPSPKMGVIMITEHKS